MAENSWMTVLIITVLGMGLLFLALAFFYALLGAMARLLQDRAEASTAVVTQAVPEAAGGEEEARLQAAAVAVALARAGLGTPGVRAAAVLAEESAGVPSPWWSLHHQRRLGRETRSGRSL
ncbi:MAG: OadG family protein [Anaerolineae bacterium]